VKAEHRAEGRIKASPMARRVAAERGIDLAAISGTGPAVGSFEMNVERAAAERTAAAAQPAARPTPEVAPTAIEGELRLSPGCVRPSQSDDPKQNLRAALLYHVGD